MLILGVDPGIAIVGYGIIQTAGNSLKAVVYGSLQTPAGVELPDRLKRIYTGLCEIIQAYQPDALAVEELFFNKNAKTALMVGHARGVAILAGINNGVNIYEYTPLQVKQAVVGYGRAEKNQVGQMVKTLLSLPEIPKPDDTADSLAVAICHAFSYNVNARLRGES